MVIVVIIMITAALAAPGMMRAFAVNRAQRATNDVARIGREARSDSIAYGRAYMLRYDAGRNGRGRLELWRGLTDTCRTNPWATIMVAGGCTTEPPAPDCVDMVELADYETGSHWVTLTTPGPTLLCFEPDDEMWTSTGSTTLFTLPLAAVTLPVQRFESATGGVPLESRGVIFPAFGPPRVQR